MKTVPTWQEEQARIDPEGEFAEHKFMQDEIDALRARLTVCEPLVEDAKRIFENCNVTADVCMCGDPLGLHGSEHSFVDMGEHNVKAWRVEYAKAFPKPEEPTDG